MNGPTTQWHAPFAVYNTIRQIQKGFTSMIEIGKQLMAVVRESQFELL